MRKGIFGVKINFNDEKILDMKYNKIEEVEKAFDGVKKKFK